MVNTCPFKVDDVLMNVGDIKAAPQDEYLIFKGVDNCTFFGKPYALFIVLLNRHCTDDRFSPTSKAFRFRMTEDYWDNFVKVGKIKYKYPDA